ncbi:hypothetical protein M0804_005811 [Polistes exclamans]|nr:hypothetical protein M0804_005811 [Polistes exclamans]
MAPVDKLPKMVETNGPSQATDEQTQFGNARQLEPSECIFVFKDTLSDYEEPPSDEEVSLNCFSFSFFQSSIQTIQLLFASLDDESLVGTILKMLERYMVSLFIRTKL